ncbi:hypothetical protein THMIRHAM_00910 [Thiomicrorhabdus immobilis]|uniref:SsuA/THI5-like domain-containing protein n=1 Tax=Thiomicrorhabdus immobilis TaxID=2791037 RepID=A0ABM7MAG2_9GAMM|nr:hypothetical protein [Thiomicrorhabdus immobilis]BCN92306.1 hypothetical protein THMIRHAM_00910 [Thiomicrorhabdus immobilis]
MPKIGFLFKSLLLVMILSVMSCSHHNNAPIKILVNSWIGYSPLFYAKEKGWLQELNIEISTVVSLGESMMTFHTGHFDGLVGTQYEYQKLKEKHYKLTPILMFDRSMGGDMVMGNRSIDELKASQQPIDVYLEINSINSLVFQQFIELHDLQNQQFNFINKDQLKIVTELKQSVPSRASIVTTYIPYNFDLTKIGFQTLGSTKEIADLLVLDALYTTKESLHKNQQTYIKLKERINQAVNALNEDPKAYYETVKPYLENTSFEEFNAGLKQIEWLNKSLPKALQQRMQKTNFPIQDLL